MYHCTKYLMCTPSIVLQTVQIAKEEITKVESAGFISFLTSTNYSMFQGRNVSVNYPSNTIKERLQNGKPIITISSYSAYIDWYNADEDITFINMIISNLGDFLTAGNNRC